MPTPVDEASFAELVVRFGRLTDIWKNSLVNIQALIALSAAAGAVTRPTYADMVADLSGADGSWALVWQDPDRLRNGLYIKDGAPGVGGWVASGLLTEGEPGAEAMAAESGFVWALVDPLTDRAALGVTPSGEVVAPKLLLPAGVVKPDNLGEALAAMVGATMPPESGYAWALTDPATGRAALAVTLDGRVVAPGLALGAETVGLGNLDDTLAALVGASLPPESGYVWALTDPTTGRAALAISVDGQIVGNIGLSGGGFETGFEAAYDGLLDRSVLPRMSDLVDVRPDGFRSADATFISSTQRSGYGWSPFPRRLTPALRGVNTTGVALQARRRNGLKIVGRRKIGDFDPTASGVQGTNYRGPMTTTSTFPPAGTYANGDYVRYVAQGGSSAARVIGSDTYAIGDVAVYNGGSWVRQAAPVGGEYDGDWFNVTAAGVFDGLNLAIGDRVVFYCGSFTRKWVKGRPDKGEHFLVGEWSAATAFPASPLDGDLHQVTAAGTQGGITFGIDDTLVRHGGVWGVVPTTTITSVVSGAYAHLTCTAASDEWEFRRSDKAAGFVYLTLKSEVQAEPKLGAVDGLVMYADSMGFFLETSAQAAFSPRPFASRSVPSARPREILGYQRSDILTGDPYQGRLHLFWHGQNSETAPQETLDCVERGVDLTGVRDGRFIVMTVLGRRTMAYNGSRMVVAQQEDQFTGNLAGAPIAKLPGWYAERFPGRWFDTRAQLGARVNSTLPDLTFPGMTEAQVAATYGVMPMSWWFNYGAVPWVPSALHFVGYHGAAGLPSGGSNLDYYLRSGNGVVGNILVKEAGTWVERTADGGQWTHMIIGGEGNVTLAAALKSFIDEKGW
jgi:hypothetical protein